MIVTHVPTSVRRPGAFSEFDFTSGAQSLIPVAARVVIVAEKTAAGTAVIETPVQIFGAADGDTKLGTGSIAAIMARTAFLQGQFSGASPEVWACPLAEPGGGTATAETLTVTGPATEAGNIELQIAGRTIIVGVSNGDSANTIAAAIKSALDAVKSSIPFTAAVVGAVVTATCTTKGVNGNDPKWLVNKKPAGVGVALAQSVAGAGVATIANALAALYDKRYQAVAISNHTTTDIAALIVERLTSWSYDQRNYRFFFVGENSTLGTAQTLQAAGNDYGIIVTSCEQTGSLPGELAVVTAVAEFSRAAPNANLDGEMVAIYPPPASYVFTAAEVESALNGGVTPLTSQGSWMQIERLVTSQISYNSAPFEAVRDIAYPRTSAALAEQIEINYSTKFKQAVNDEDFKDRVRDMVIGVQRAFEANKWIKDVNTFLGQIQVEDAVGVAGRVNISDPHRVAGPVHQAVTVHTMYQ